MGCQAHFTISTYNCTSGAQLLKVISASPSQRFITGRAFFLLPFCLTFPVLCLLTQLQDSSSIMKVHPSKALQAAPWKRRPLLLRARPAETDVSDSPSRCPTSSESTRPRKQAADWTHSKWIPPHHTPLFLLHLLQDFFKQSLLLPTPWDWRISGFCRWKVKVTQSCLTLHDPKDCSTPGSSVHEILQARILEWVTKSTSRGPSWPRDQTHICQHLLHCRRVFYQLNHQGRLKSATGPLLLFPPSQLFSTLSAY